MRKLYWNTVTPSLQSGLKLIMGEPLFQPFRLVGGTSLSLQTGHRMSIDIDLFTDRPYGSVDFYELDKLLRKTFSYVTPDSLPGNIALGTSYILGNSPQDAFKLDLYYTDRFVWEETVWENIRMASLEEIAAMKMDIVQRGGRKKDFWDIHELSGKFTINDMISFHQQRYPYAHDEEMIKKNLTCFSAADNDFDPVCLRGKYWEIIKLDIVEMLGE